MEKANVPFSSLQARKTSGHLCDQGHMHALPEIHDQTVHSALLRVRVPSGCKRTEPPGAYQPALQCHTGLLAAQDRLEK